MATPKPGEVPGAGRPEPRPAPDTTQQGGKPDRRSDSSTGLLGGGESLDPRAKRWNATAQPQ